MLSRPTTRISRRTSTSTWEAHLTTKRCLTERQSVATFEPNAGVFLRTALSVLAASAVFALSAPSFAAPEATQAAAADSAATPCVCDPKICVPNAGLPDPNAYRHDGFFL